MYDDGFSLSSVSYINIYILYGYKSGATVRRFFFLLSFLSLSDRRRRALQRLTLRRARSEETEGRRRAMTGPTTTRTAVTGTG